MTTDFLDSLRLASKSERRGNYAASLSHLEAAFETCPSEIEEMIGMKIQTVETKLHEQRKEQLGMFGKVRYAATGKLKP